jgi:hypothetical protein
VPNGPDCEAKAKSTWSAVVQTRLFTCRWADWMHTEIVLKLPIWASAGRDAFVTAVGLRQSMNQFLRRNWEAEPATAKSTPGVVECFVGYHRNGQY